MSKNTILTCIRDYVDTFVYTLESSGCPLLPAPVYIGHDMPPPQCIIYNTEQLTRQSVLEKLLFNIKETNPIGIWDYSSINVSILKENGIDAVHIPLTSPKWYIDRLREYRNLTERIWDVGFSGGMTPRREKIINELLSIGISVNIVTLFGCDRDFELSKCKIILNIHAGDDYLIYESARCEPWLKLGVVVVSEASLDDDPRCVSASYDTLVSTVSSEVSNWNRINGGVTEETAVE